MDGSASANAGLLKSSAGAGDLFYGLSSSNLNTLYGKVSLGEWTSVRANAELQGIYTVRNSVFLDGNGDEVTVSPFTAGVWAGGDFPGTDDIGALVSAQAIADVPLGATVLKWLPSTAATGGSGFKDVAVVVDVRGEEVDIMLPNVLAAYKSF
jgi:hypothetical protein